MQMVYKFRFSADKFSIVLRSKAQSMISSKPHSSNSLLRVVMSLYKIDVGVMKGSKEWRWNRY